MSSSSSVEGATERSHAAVSNRSSCLTLASLAESEIRSVLISRIVILSINSPGATSTEIGAEVTSCRGLSARSNKGRIAIASRIAPKGSREVAIDCVGHAEVCQHLHPPGRQFEASEVAANGLLRVLSSQSHDTERRPALGMVRMSRKETPNARFGVGKVPRALMFPAPRKLSSTTTFPPLSFFPTRGHHRPLRKELFDSNLPCARVGSSTWDPAPCHELLRSRNGSRSSRQPMDVKFPRDRGSALADRRSAARVRSSPEMSGPAQECPHWPDRPPQDVSPLGSDRLRVPRVDPPASLTRSSTAAFLPDCRTRSPTWRHVPRSHFPDRNTRRTRKDQ